MPGWIGIGVGAGTIKNPPSLVPEHLVFNTEPTCPYTRRVYASLSIYPFVADRVTKFDQSWPGCQSRSKVTLDKGWVKLKIIKPGGLTSTSSSFILINLCRLRFHLCLCIHPLSCERVTFFTLASPFILITH